MLMGDARQLYRKVCLQTELRTSKNSSTLVCASQTAGSQAPDLGVQQALLKVVRPLFYELARDSAAHPYQRGALRASRYGLGNRPADEMHACHSARIELSGSLNQPSIAGQDCK